MKDLIKEIEGSKVYECEVERHSLGIIYVKDCKLKENEEPNRDTCVECKAEWLDKEVLDNE